MVDINPATMPKKMSVIDRLMNEIDNLCSLKSSQYEDEHLVGCVATDARQLILDLLNLSDKPQGEQIYETACKKIDGQYDDDHSLPDAIRFVKTWTADTFPANDQGQVHFGRALIESLVRAGERHLAAEKIERRIAENKSSTSAIYEASKQRASKCSYDTCRYEGYCCNWHAMHACPVKEPRIK